MIVQDVMSHLIGGFRFCGPMNLKINEADDWMMIQHYNAPFHPHGFSFQNFISHELG